MSSFIPDSEVTLDPLPAATLAPNQTPIPESDVITDNDVLLDEDKYGTLGQQAITSVEGLAEGIAGPLAPLIETKVLGVKSEDILGRREENPISHGAGQVGGLTAGLLTGMGEGEIMSKAGKLALEAAGLNETSKTVSLGHKVGSAIVREATENAILQGSDEISKMVLQDPSTSAESAIGNIGLAAALGGAGGAFISGAVSPLWHATAGPKLEQSLGMLKDHFNGAKILSAESEAAANVIGKDLSPLERAIVSQDPRVQSPATTLGYAQNAEYGEAVDSIKTKVNDSVKESLGLPEEILSKNEAGHSLEDAFKKEYKQKYEPVEKQFKAREELASTISLSDEARLDQFGQIMEKALKVGPNEPEYKLYEHWANRLLDRETVGGLDELRTKLGRDIDKAYRGGDGNTAAALQDIRRSLGDFQESQITKQASQLEAEGAEFGKAIGKDILAEREAANAAYTQFAGMSRELLDHAGAGRFSGAGGLLKKIEEIGAEKLVSKFSPKNNADMIPFLQKHFPETLEKVRQNELWAIIKPAVSLDNGTVAIDAAKLSKILEKNIIEKKELLHFALPANAIEKIKAAQTLLEAIPKRRDSGTPGGMTRLLKDMPRNAMAFLAMFMGHNPITGAIVGEVTQKLGRDVPDAIRLAHLKFLGSDQPVKASGFKAMVDYLDNVQKGESFTANAVKGVFKKGIQVMATNHYPTDKDREKLDKKVAALQDRPEALLNMPTSDVGHYMPDHQAAMATATTTALGYLQSIKPRGYKPSPLDKEIPPTPEQNARYDRALDIAQQPAIVLKHVKDGTLQMSDIKDLSSLYPGLYKSFCQKLTNEMTNAVDNEEVIPYKVRQSVSLFLGQPLDSSMLPASIQAAQMSLKPQIGAQETQTGAMPAKSTKSLSKITKSYLTPLQASEAHSAEKSK